MHTTNELTLPRERAARSSWLEGHVLRALAGMRQGYLRLALPDGEVYDFGDPHASEHAAITVRNPDFFKKCLLYGDVGFGESYVDGDWETDNIAAVIGWFLQNADN